MDTVSIRKQVVAALLFVALWAQPSDAFLLTASSGPAPAMPIWGITFDTVSGVSALNTVLTSMVHRPTTRIVFDTGQSATGIYLSPLTTFHANSDIMGELIDSSYMKSYTTAQAATWTQQYYNALHTVVDIWEIGNEVNGNWLSALTDGSDVMPKIEAMYDNVASCGGGGCAPGVTPATALTFFYEGEPSDPKNCIATDHGGNDMFTWINTNFQAAPTTETEKIRLGVTYVLVSWYPDQCQNTTTTATLNAPTVFSRLATIFPNSKVGFGELGSATATSCTNNVTTLCSYDKNLIDTYYSLRPGIGGLPRNYIVGNFWWYAAEQLNPWPGVTNAVFPSGMGVEINAQIQ